MKPLYVLLSVVTALAVAVPVVPDAALDVQASHAEHNIIVARNETNLMNGTAPPGPNTPVASEHGPVNGTVAIPKDPTAGYWDYDITCTEYWNGSQLHSHILIKTHYEEYILDFQGEGYFVWLKLSDQYLQIFYNWVEHRTLFKYRESAWSLDAYSNSKDLMAMCVVKEDWNKPILAPNSKEDRKITSSCWIKLRDGEEIWARANKLDGVATRDTNSKPDAATTMTVLDLSPSSSGNLPPPTPGFWSYEMTITESYEVEKPVVTADFNSDGGVRGRIDFVDSYHQFSTNVFGKAFIFSYDFAKHQANFYYGNDHWGMDMYSAVPHGFCTSGEGWNKAPLEPNSDDFRQITISCWIHPSDNLSIGDPNLIQVAPRALTPNPTVTTTVSTSTYVESTATDGPVNYAFDIGVIELCENSNEAPVRALATWVPHTGSEPGVDIDLEEGNTVKTFALGDTYMTVGTYDYNTHQLGFHYGGCNWNLETAGVAHCGYCHPAKWSAKEVDCKSDVNAHRTYAAVCHVLAYPNVSN